MASSDQATSTDAVSVLLNAAPSSVVQSFESAFESLTSDLLGSTSQPTAAPTSQSQPTDTPSNAPPASLPASRPTQNTNPPISSPFSRPTIFSTPTPSTFLTAAARPTSTTPPPSTTPLPATSSSTTGQLKNASVAGVATGLAAAFVLFTLAAIYLYRRHQQGKPLPFFSSSSGRFSRLARSRGTNNNRDSQRAFPESAWLYDPARTPPRNGSPPPQLPPLEHEMQEDRHFSSSTLGLGVGEGSASEMLLIPEPREGAVELGGSAPNSPPRGEAEGGEGAEAGLGSVVERREPELEPGWVLVETAEWESVFWVWVVGEEEYESVSYSRAQEQGEFVGGRESDGFDEAYECDLGGGAFERGRRWWGWVCG
ncbi:hypothetical protein B0A54_04980 [Friedmanniomyces endolithicus]|uniref:Uncharacterized protein n=1 Tax=Friedmanniomyces endolithicus TaxID=329885 RepID=A0A4U0V6N0_9PEZI|nr:hypothetical protein B0A54_04980 [Friedmanniomyces endolithicus]